MLILFYRIWSFVKLIYLYIAYWAVGLEEEEFYIPKANYCADIGWYNAAIKTYKKALNESNNPLIHSALGWCYAEVGDNEKSVEHYRIAYDKKNYPEIGIGLAYAEYNVGNIKEFQNIYLKLNNSRAVLSPESQEELNKLQAIWENVARETGINNISI